MNLTLDDLVNIRDTLNDHIFNLVQAAGKPDAKPGNYTRAASIAETRDKIQEEIDIRRNSQPT